MSHITLQNASCLYRSSQATTVPGMQNLNLDVSSGEFLVILGPSGSGKTTLLRTIAGLETLSGGEIRFDNERVNETPPADRNVGMVFQRPALFPHLTVAKNLALPLKIRRLPLPEIQEATLSIAQKLKIEPLLHRLPGQLSGGEQQRAALAKALIRQPSLLLLDEPLVSLDPPLRRQLRQEIITIQKATQITTLYVTHNPMDAAQINSRIAIMNGGHILQTGTLQELHAHPASPLVTDLLKPD